MEFEAFMRKYKSGVTLPAFQFHGFVGHSTPNTTTLVGAFKEKQSNIARVQCRKVKYQRKEGHTKIKSRTRTRSRNRRSRNKGRIR